jgi:uncharacterized membrane protein
MARRYTAILTAFLTLVLSVQVIAKDRHQPARTAELRYRLVEVFRALPDGGREELSPLSINDRGEVLALGSLRVTQTGDPFIDGYPRPRNFIWRNGRVITELVSPNPAFPDVESRRINNRGEVVGSLSRYDPGYSVRTAFVWRRGHFTELQGLPAPLGDYYVASAESINEWGEIAGTTVDNDIDVFATPFRWYRGRSTRVPVDPALSASAVDINNWGQVVGNSVPGVYEPYAGPYGGYLADRKGNVHFLESLPGSERMSPIAINDRGQIIGAVDDRAVLWEDGAVLDLGTLPGASSARAAAINFFGTIVGRVAYASGDTTAIIWRDGEMRDLNELVAGNDPIGSSVHLVSASDVNNLGWIAARGTVDAPPNTRGRAYLLIPVWKHRR